jgi:hypothetical protein
MNIGCVAFSPSDTKSLRLNSGDVIALGQMAAGAEEPFGQFGLCDREQLYAVA